MHLSQIYRPLSASPFRCDAEYAERPPCPALVPYVHCFWGTSEAPPVHSGGGRVIPDTCMDVLFEINYTQNRIVRRFCALDDAAYQTPPCHSNDLCATFGIRFYAWSAICFSEDALGDTMRTTCDPMRFFSKLCRELEPRLFDLKTLADRAQFAEALLVRHLNPDRMSRDVLNALYAMIHQRGAFRARDAAQAACVGQRQLERLARAMTGASPKMLAQLIRHQLVYRDLLEGRFHPMDTVARYGYADQSHLLRDFRKFHGISPRGALEELKMSHLFYTET